MKDYKQVERGLLTIADKVQPDNSMINGPSPFKGHNFITNIIITRRKLKNGVWFELSYGKGMLDDNFLLGVTLMKGEKSFEDIQGCFSELSEVEEALKKALKIK